MQLRDWERAGLRGIAKPPKKAKIFLSLVLRSYFGASYSSYQPLRFLLLPRRSADCHVVALHRSVCVTKHAGLATVAEAGLSIQPNHMPRRSHAAYCLAVPDCEAALSYTRLVCWWMV